MGRKEIEREKVKGYVDKAYFESGLSDKDFSEFMRKVLFTYPYKEDDYMKEVINSRLVISLADKIWKHPILWKIFMH